MGQSEQTNFYIPKVGDVVTGTVISVSDSEALIDVGYSCEGVIYKEHLATEKISSVKDILKVDDQVKVKITQFRQGDETDSLLLSRLDILRKEKQDKFRDEVEVDKELTFKVKKSVKGGLLLDFHGIEAFLPDSLVTLGKNLEEEKAAIVGKNVEARVIEIKQKGRFERIIVNRKQLQYETLRQAEKEEFQTFEVDQVVKGTVKRITEYGAFVEIGDHTEGLVHVSEVSHYRVKNVADFLEIGQEVETKIIKIKGKRISLSIKALLDTPWSHFVKQYKVGDKVTGTVVRKMQYGILIEVEKEVVGLLNKFDYSWNPDENLAGTLEVGDSIEVKITSINNDKQQFALSKKHLEYNPWADIKFKKGDQVSAQVLRIEEKGAVVEVEGVEAFLPIGECSLEHIQKVEEAVKVDEVYTVEVLEFNPRQWKLVVSIKSILYRKSREEYENQLSENVSSDQNLADLFKGFKK
jgi:small subunit ribosomal protein S1